MKGESIVIDLVLLVGEFEEETNVNMESSISEPGGLAIEGGRGLRLGVHIECQESVPRAALEEILGVGPELLEPKLVTETLPVSEPNGNPIATTVIMSKSLAVRSPALKKRLLEPQSSPIPPAVRNLILLGSLNAPQSLELKDLQSLSFGKLFGAKHELKGVDMKWADLSAERAATVRLMLLAALGTCPSLRALNLGNSHKLPRFHLSLRELEELLEPLQSSQEILELNLDGQETLETEEGCRILERFLANNRTLETLHIFGSGLHRHILESLVSSGHPTLRNLGVYLNPTEDEVFDTVCAILQACPKLQEMPNVEWRCDDDKDAERWAQVLTTHDSFNAVEIAGSVGSLGVFLWSLLDSTCQLCLKKNLRKLKMMSLDDEFQRMPEQIVSLTVSANRNLEAVDLVGICISSNEWLEVFRTLKHNAVLRNLQLEDMQQGFNSAVWEELGALVEVSAKLEVLKIHDPSVHAQPGVEYVFRAMQINRSLKKVKLLLFGHEVDKEAVSALAKSLETNDVLEHLALDGCVIPDLEAVFRSLHRNTKLRKLDLCSCKGLNDGACRELLSALRINSAIREINLSHTNWVEDGRKEGWWATPCEAIEVREPRDRYTKLMREFWEPDNFEQMNGKLNFGDR